MNTELSTKLDEILPDEYREMLLDAENHTALEPATAITIGRYFNDAELKRKISDIALNYLSFPAGFRWPILSNDTSFALVYLDSFDNPQVLKKQTLNILVNQFSFSLIRINKLLLELESLEKSYNK